MYLLSRYLLYTSKCIKYQSNFYEVYKVDSTYFLFGGFSLLQLNSSVAWLKNIELLYFWSFSNKSLQETN